MNQQNIRALTLLDLLGRSWQLAAPVERVAFSADGATLAFAGADGSVALAPVADPEAPDSRIRVSVDLGQTTIRPRERPPAPLTLVAALSSTTPPLAAFGKQDFLIGTEQGEVQRLTAAGERHETGVTLGKAVRALDHAPASDFVAASDGGGITLYGAGGSPGTLAPPEGAGPRDLSFSPDALALAVAHEGGLAIWSVAGETKQLRSFALPGQPGKPQWSRDGRWLACPLETGFALVDLAGDGIGLVTDFPMPVRMTALSGPADAVIAAGAYRIAAWSLKAPPIGGETAGALVTGRAGLVAVTAVAAHPHKPLVAAGHANGQIVVAQIGARDEMPVGMVDGAVLALAWSADGRHLAVGAADGTAAIVSFPTHLLK